MPALMALRSAQLKTPVVTALYRNLVEVAEWEPDDPRLPAFADRLVEHIEESARPWEDHGTASDFALDDALVRLLDEVFVRTVPVAPRLLTLLEQRGWRGWTDLKRVECPPR